MKSIVIKKLQQEFQNEFLVTHKTKAKLSFAEEKGIEIPEIFYLLGIIYNEGFHINNNQDWITPLRSKLDNIIIKNMIQEVIKTTEKKEKI